MKVIEDIKDALAECLKVEESSRISDNASYGDMFKEGVLNLNHAEFPLSSLQQKQLDSTQAKEAINSTYKKYNKKGFLAEYGGDLLKANPSMSMQNYIILSSCMICTLN